MDAPDLYAALGLPKNAPQSDIPKAYRRMSKKTHPDAPGGSAEAFALVTLARDVLSDEARRKHYDETGEIDRPDPDTSEGQAMMQAMAAIMAVVAKWEAVGRPVEQVDILIQASDQIKGQIRQINSQVKEGRKKVDKQRKLAKRFKSRLIGKPPIIAIMMEARATDMERDIANHLKPIPILERALEILDDHEFDMDKTPPMSEGVLLKRLWNVE